MCENVDSCQYAHPRSIFVKNLATKPLNVVKPKYRFGLATSIPYTVKLQRLEH